MIVIKMVRAPLSIFVLEMCHLCGEQPESLLPGGLCDKLGEQWGMASLFSWKLPKNLWHVQSWGPADGGLGEFL